MKKEELTEREREIKIAFGEWLTHESGNKFGYISGAEWADKHPSTELILDIIQAYGACDEMPWNEAVEFIKNEIAKKK